MNHSEMSENDRKLVVSLVKEQIRSKKASMVWARRGLERCIADGDMINAGHYMADLNDGVAWIRGVQDTLRLLGIEEENSDVG